jgi:2-polyprenyl-3-methyl-5-hydroxy-6-metoxy-1,4-benzoquinol methylase
MTEPNQSNNAYALGYSETELRRLQCQSEFYRPLTRAIIEDAGIKPGMCIIDIGCGVGDVSFLLSEIVGPEGEVIGIDLGELAVQRAMARAQELGLRNVRFFQGNERSAVALSKEAPIDAVFGRFVLLHQQQPVSFVRTLAEAVRPGGLLVFQDPDYSLLLQSNPPLPLADQVRRWIFAGHAGIGAATDISFRIPGIFRAAGLQPPKQRLVCPIISSQYELICQVAAELIEVFEPLLIKQDVASAAEINIDSLAARLVDGLQRNRSVLQPLCLADTWLRLPAP